MFTRKQSWSLRAGKALLFAGILYKIARMFMKSTGKPLRRKKSNDDDELVKALRQAIKKW